MKKGKLNPGFSVVTIMILLAAISRLLPHPFNFAPIGGMALFGAAYFRKRYWAFIIPIISMWISDLILNNVIYRAYTGHFVWFYSSAYFTYGAFIIIVIVGMLLLRKVKVSAIILASISASILFFIISNFGVWAMSGMYPHSKEGLITCYLAGLPFLQNTVLGDLVYSAALFGIFELASKRWHQLRSVKQFNLQN